MRAPGRDPKDRFRSLLIVLVVGLPCLLAQPERPASVQDAPVQDALDQEIAGLVAQQDMVEVVLGVARILAKPDFAEKAPARFLKALDDSRATDAFREGVIRSLTKERPKDDAVLEALVRVHEQRPALRAAMVRLARAPERQATVSGVVRQRLAVATEPDGLAALAELLEVLIQDQGSRREAVEALLLALERVGSDAGTGLVEGLRRVTLQEWRTAPQWRTWFDAYTTVNPEGFSMLELHRDAVARARAEELEAAGGLREELKRAITLLAERQDFAAVGQWLDPARPGGPSVRRHALQAILAAAGLQAETRKQAVKVLAERLSSMEPGGELESMALDALPGLVLDAPSLHPQLATVLTPLLSLPDAPTPAELERVRRAVRVLVNCSGEGLPASAVAAYRHLRNRDLAPKLRLDLVVGCDRWGVVPPGLENALSDPEPTVRQAAGNVLALRGDPVHAPALAQALLAEKDTRVQGSFAKNLEDLGHFEDAEVVTALLGLARETTTPPEVRMPALVALARAAGGEKTAADDAVQTFLIASWSEKLSPALCGGMLEALAAGTAARRFAVLEGWARTNPPPAVQGLLARAVRRTAGATVAQQLTVLEALEGGEAEVLALGQAVLARIEAVAPLDLALFGRAAVLTAEVGVRRGGPAELTDAIRLLGRALGQELPAELALRGQLALARGHRLQALAAGRDRALLEKSAAAYQRVRELRGEGTASVTVRMEEAGVLNLLGRAQEVLDLLPSEILPGIEAAGGRRGRYERALALFSLGKLGEALNLVRVARQGAPPPTDRDLDLLEVDILLAAPTIESVELGLELAARLKAEGAALSPASETARERVSRVRDLVAALDAAHEGDDQPARAAALEALARAGIEHRLLGIWLCKIGEQITPAALRGRVLALTRFFQAVPPLEGVALDDAAARADFLRSLAAWWGKGPQPL